MALFDIADLSALEILDSRGRPTLAVTVRLADSTRGSARIARLSGRNGPSWEVARAIRAGRPGQPGTFVGTAEPVT